MNAQRLLVPSIIILGVFCCSCSSQYQVTTPLSSGYYYCIHGDSVNSAPRYFPELISSEPPKEAKEAEKPEWIDYIFTQNSIISLIIILLGNSR